MNKQQKRIDALISRARKTASGSHKNEFPDLSTLSYHELSHSVPKGVSPVERPLEDHRWKRDAKDKKEAIQSAESKRKYIGPVGHKMGDAYLGPEAFSEIISGAKRRI